MVWCLRGEFKICQYHYTPQVVKGWDFLLDWISIKVSQKKRTDKVGQAGHHVKTSTNNDKFRGSRLNSKNKLNSMIHSRYSSVLELNVNKLRKWN